MMSRAERFALLVSFVTVLAATWISLAIFEGIPHLEDEYAYVWQAKVIARGNITIPSPPEPKSFLVPFVVDYEGVRFGKYPIGWPTLLSLGERLGARWLVNPLLAGLCVWFTFRLGTKLLGEAAGLLAAVLTATSPFFLMNSGVLLSHSLGLFLATSLAVSWLDAMEEKPGLPGWLPPLAAGGALGALALTRPFTAIGVAIPFGIHGLVILFSGSTFQKKRVLAIGAITLIISSLHLVWQYAVSGDPLLNPYTLWWAYDKVGFGPGVGVTEEGHNLDIAWRNLKVSMDAGSRDLFGWWKFSWIFLPFGLWALRKRTGTWTVLAVAPSLILIYMGYWIGAWVLGPRYYFEGLFSLTITTAAGILLLAGWSLKTGQRLSQMTARSKLRLFLTATLVLVLMISNLSFYLPGRIGGMKALFGTSREQLAPFQQSEALKTPALIIVDTEIWREYAGLLELSDPMLDSPFIFIWDRGPGPNRRVMDAFPDRSVYYYNPEQAWVFTHLLDK